MSCDYATCKRSLERLFGLGALGKIKFLLQFGIVRAQGPPSGEETERQNYLRHLLFHLHGAALKTDTVGDRLTNTFSKDFCVRITNTYSDNEHFQERFFVFGQRTHIRR
ncbi:hypothetical protein TNCV_4940111 [Trichonephila clavipes]|nr:hypothetical protein TNCV_4940111 [Trichonephila clavipes]